MFETIKRIYAKTGNDEVVSRALEKGWITPEEVTEIYSTPKAPEVSPE